MADPEDWGVARNVDHIEAALNEERRKFQQETLRTSELSALLLRWVQRHEAEHEPGPWSRSCDVCALVGESRALLAKPVNTTVQQQDTPQESVKEPAAPIQQQGAKT